MAGLQSASIQHFSNQHTEKLDFLHQRLQPVTIQSLQKLTIEAGKATIHHSNLCWTWLIWGM